MRIAENTQVIKLETDTGCFYPILMCDHKDVILIDTGLPTSRESLITKIQECGFESKDITKVLLTHQDIEHFGNAHYYASKGAKIYASAVDAPFIEGVKKLEKLQKLETMENRNQMEEAIYQVIRDHVGTCNVHVDTLLEDGQYLDICGGITVVDLAGHTSGHIGYYLHASNLFVVGDAAQIVNGKLEASEASFCSDYKQALQSYQKILSSEADGIILYHSGLYKIKS